MLNSAADFTTIFSFYDGQGFMTRSIEIKSCHRARWRKRFACLLAQRQEHNLADYFSARGLTYR